ncbi:hypothetical protein K1719_004052 [Acacia pycnantha]|nr:hypothetical protein K1719_004052 [Acacia pycnantha]
MRDGQHARQEALINDDVVPPVYVYHIQDPQPSEPLVNELKRYYGMLHVAVELFSQAGAQVGKAESHELHRSISHSSSLASVLSDKTSNLRLPKPNQTSDPLFSPFLMLLSLIPDLNRAANAIQKLQIGASGKANGRRQRSLNAQ